MKIYLTNESATRSLNIDSYDFVWNTSYLSFFNFHGCFTICSNLPNDIPLCWYVTWIIFKNLTEKFAVSCVFGVSNFRCKANGRKSLLCNLWHHSSFLLFLLKIIFDEVILLGCLLYIYMYIELFVKSTHKIIT